jgi:biuret amidohydrolase
MRGTIAWQTDPTWPHSVPELEIDLDHTALLVVDMQNPDRYGVVTDNCEKLIGYFRDKGMENIFLRVGYFLEDRHDMHAKRAQAWLRKGDGSGPTMLMGADDQAIIARLTPTDSEIVIDKNSTSAFNSTGLEAYLHARQVETLIVCGMATNHCVDNTARGAADRGYNVVMINDACWDPSERLHEATMRSFRRALGAVKNTDDLLAEVDGILTGAPDNA